LQPLAPTGVTATDVGTNRAYDDGAASVSFSLPGNSQPATSYTITASTGQSATGSSSPIVVTGIATGTTPTFTVKATNSYGDSPSSDASSGITITTVPAAPGGVGASSPYGADYDTVSWNAPANGGKSITNYYITSNDGKAANTSSTSVNITQEQGTAQTYTVYADNANGRSVASAASGSVTTFSFVPFSVFSFFGVFGFVPTFGVFGFVPFSVFGFVPTFGVFGFTPVFGVFSFFGVFGFTPRFSVFAFR
jgi:hypothetical protein